MAGKKDFSKLNTGRVYNAIAEATAEPDEQKVYNAQEVQQESNEGQRYTEEERQEYLRSGKTQGRSGCKAPRINIAFYPEQYDYIKTMAAARGQSMTDFVNHVLSLSMKENAAIYEQAKEFLKAF